MIISLFIFVHISKKIDKFMEWIPKILENIRKVSVISLCNSLCVRSTSYWSRAGGKAGPWIRERLLLQVLFAA